MRWSTLASEGDGRADGMMGARPHPLAPSPTRSGGGGIEPPLPRAGERARGWGQTAARSPQPAQQTPSAASRMSCHHPNTSIKHPSREAIFDGERRGEEIAAARHTLPILTEARDGTITSEHRCAERDSPTPRQDHSIVIHAGDLAAAAGMEAAPDRRAGQYRRRVARLRRAALHTDRAGRGRAQRALWPVRLPPMSSSTASATSPTQQNLTTIQQQLDRHLQERHGAIRRRPVSRNSRLRCPMLRSRNLA